MSVFVCLVRTDGAPVYEAMCRRYGAKREVPRVVPPSWCMMGDFAVMLGSDVPGLVPRVARYGQWVGVGLVRLDEKPDQARRECDSAVASSADSCATESGVADGQAWNDGIGASDAGNGSAADVSVADVTAADASTADCSAADLATVLEIIAESGASGVEMLVGDFAFVAWNHERRQLVAARDTFGVRRLYMARRGDLLTFSTRASLLARTESYDMEYFAEYLLHGDDPSGRTAFSEVEAVRSAELVTWDRGTLRKTRYWEPPEEGSTIVKSGPEVVEEFRSLLFDAVMSRLTGRTNVWSHLTGGMDSSSVVAVAETLAARGDVAHGVAGVVTYESDPPLGGDVDHARMVAERYGLRHEVLRGWRVWDDDGEGAPLLDQPAYEQANYAIERRLAKAVTGSGGNVLLTGVGGDLYLRPQFERAADLVARGRVCEAVRLVSQWAVASRRSFWKLFGEHCVYPLLPATARYRLGKPALRVPAWIDEDFSRRLRLRERAGALRYYTASGGRKSRSLVAHALFTHAARVGHERLGEVNLEWHHPFFHRPLVEYGLRLAEEWRVAPGADLSKRVMREAMSGLLPDPVRLRRGKGGLQPDIQNAIERRKLYFVEIVERPVLGELGCLSTTRFRSAVEEPRSLAPGEVFTVSKALTLELWLRQRLTGRS